MDRISVNSTNLRSIGYDADALILQVEFRDGSVWNYHGVAQSLFDRLLHASSKGSFFHDHIKDRFTARQVR